MKEEASSNYYTMREEMILMPFIETSDPCQSVLLAMGHWCA
jgi:hypothetical protein